MKKFLNFLTYFASILVTLSACILCVYFYPWQFVVGFLTLVIGVLSFYLWKFAKIIIILEDDLGNAIQSLEEVETSMQNIIDMKLYFDTPEVQQLVSHVMDSVKLSKFSVNKMIKNFTDRSKQKFIMVLEEEGDQSIEQQELNSGVNEVKPSQLKEGTIASVER